MRQFAQLSALAGSPALTRSNNACLGTVGRKSKGVGMTNFNAPDQDVQAAKLRAQDVQRARQRSQPAKSRKPGRVRLILRRILGRENPPSS
jgi:hypothetical protein